MLYAFAEKLSTIYYDTAFDKKDEKMNDKR